MSSLYIEETLSYTTDVNVMVVNGFTQRYFAKQVPLDVIKLIAKFSENTRIIFNLSDIELEKFVTAKCGIATQNATISFHGIDFEVCMYPNGDNNWDNRGYVIMTLQLTKLPPNIMSILVYYELFSLETDTVWKDVSSLITGDIKKWDKITLSLDECIETMDISRSIEKYDTSKLIQDLKNKQLTFGCYVNILEIKYDFSKNYEILKNFKTRMNVLSYYKFEIDQSIFKYFINPSSSSKNYDPKILYSPNFSNECWSLKIVPFTTDNMKSVIILKILRLPNKITKIKIKHEINVFYNNSNKPGITNTAYSVILPFKSIYLMSMPSHRVNGYKAISFSVCIELIEAYHGNEKIDEQNWHQFDIIMEGNNDNKDSNKYNDNDNQQCTNCVLL